MRINSEVRLHWVLAFVVVVTVLASQALMWTLASDPHSGQNANAAAVNAAPWFVMALPVIAASIGTSWTGALAQPARSPHQLGLYVGLAWAPQSFVAVAASFVSLEIGIFPIMLGFAGIAAQYGMVRSFRATAPGPFRGKEAVAMRGIRAEHVANVLLASSAGILTATTVGWMAAIADPVKVFSGLTLQVVAVVAIGASILPALGLFLRPMLGIGRFRIYLALPYIAWAIAATIAIATTEIDIVSLAILSVVLIPASLYARDLFSTGLRGGHDGAVARVSR